MLPTIPELPQENSLLPQLLSIATESLDSVAVVSSITLAAAAEINNTHRLAISSAKDAIRHAIRCGQLLLGQKDRLAYGQFGKWIETNCEFAYSTAARYMKAAQSFSTGVEISSLSAVFPSGRRPAQKKLEVECKDYSPLESVLETPTEAAQAAEINTEEALSVLRKTRYGGKTRERVLADYENASAAVKRLRKELEHAEIRQRNAESNVKSLALRSGSDSSTTKAPAPTEIAARVSPGMPLSHELANVGPRQLLAKVAPAGGWRR